VAVPVFGLLAVYLYLAGGVQTVTITWDGEAGDGLWSTPLNWSTDVVPSSTDDIIFNSSNVTDATIDPAFHGTIAGIQIQSGYTGTITQARSLRVNGPFTMASGTFFGNSDTIDIN
jgi:hypothetical protein